MFLLLLRLVLGATNFRIAPHSNKMLSLFRNKENRFETSPVMDTRVLANFVDVNGYVVVTLDGNEIFYTKKGLFAAKKVDSGEQNDAKNNSRPSKKSDTSDNGEVKNKPDEKNESKKAESDSEKKDNKDEDSKEGDGTNSSEPSDKDEDNKTSKNDDKKDQDESKDNEKDSTKDEEEDTSKDDEKDNSKDDAKDEEKDKSKDGEKDESKNDDKTVKPDESDTGANNKDGNKDGTGPKASTQKNKYHHLKTQISNQFILKPVNDGYSLQTIFNTCLHAENEVTLHTCNNSENQIFYFVPVEIEFEHPVCISDELDRNSSKSPKSKPNNNEKSDEKKKADENSETSDSEEESEENKEDDTKNTKSESESPTENSNKKDEEEARKKDEKKQGILPRRRLTPVQIHDLAGRASGVNPKVSNHFINTNEGVKMVTTKRHQNVPLIQNAPHDAAHRVLVSKDGVILPMQKKIVMVHKQSGVGGPQKMAMVQ